MNGPPAAAAPPLGGRGRLLVISGPSGAGKTSICQELLARLPGSVWSVSVTTRAPRGGEKPGCAYHFVSPAEFDDLVARGELLEHAFYLGNGYGTPRRPIEDAVAAGRVVVLEIDVQGAAQIAQKAPDSVRVFVLPPTLDALRDRLIGRGTESDEIQQRRLAQAHREIDFARQSGCFTLIITNDTIESSVQRILAALAQESATA